MEEDIDFSLDLEYKPAAAAYAYHKLEWLEYPILKNNKFLDEITSNYNVKTVNTRTDNVSHLFFLVLVKSKLLKSANRLIKNLL